MDSSSSLCHNRFSAHESEQLKMPSISSVVLVFLTLGLATALPSLHSAEQNQKLFAPVDKYSKERKDTSLCSSVDFACGDGKCIPSTWVCDFEIDCSDESDESYCNIQKTDCAPDEYQCKDETCNRVDQRIRENLYYVLQSLKLMLTLMLGLYEADCAIYTKNSTKC